MLVEFRNVIRSIEQASKRVADWLGLTAPLSLPQLAEGVRQLMRADIGMAFGTYASATVLQARKTGGGRRCGQSADWGYPATFAAAQLSGILIYSMIASARPPSIVCVWHF